MNTAEDTKGGRTRRAILAAAVPQFADHGFRGTTLAAVAHEAGITPTALYRYFGDKDELFAAAVDADAEDLVALARAALDSGAGGTLFDLLGAVTDGLAVAVQDHPLVARVLGGRDILSPDRILQLPALAHLRDEIAEVIAFGQEAGIVRSDLDPRTTVLALETVVLDHVAFMVAAGGPDGTKNERWAAVVALLEVALQPVPER